MSDETPQAPEPFPVSPNEALAPQKSGMSVGTQILLGAIIGPFVLAAVALAFGMMAGLLGSVIDSDAVTGVTALLSLVAPLALVVIGVFPARTRWFAVGAIIGTAVAFIVLAGACIVMLSNMSFGP